MDIGTLFTSIQAYLSSIYINNYNKYGQVYQVNSWPKACRKNRKTSLDCGW